jgi:peroxiredoxin
MSLESKPALQPGELAPDFTVSVVQEDRTVSLADYRGRTTLLLGLFPGVFCPFCRRSVAHMAASAEKLRAVGVETLAIVATELDNARLFYRYRPVRMLLGADPHLATHRSYHVPHPELTPELMEAVAATRINPTGELPHPMRVPDAAEELERRDAYPHTERDMRDSEKQLSLLKGQFLIDPDGVVRWANIECAREGLSGLGKFPTYEELLEAVQAVDATAR